MSDHFFFVPPGISLAPLPLADRAIAALRNLRLQPAPKELDLYTAITRALQQAAPVVRREVELWSVAEPPRRVGRIDYLIEEGAWSVGVEVKAGVVNHTAVIEQLTRYSRSYFFPELILVTEQGCRDLPAEINGMRVYQVVLSHLWGIAV